MKKILILALLFSSSILSAKSAAIYYTEGSGAGPLVDHSGYLGYGPACYRGNPWAARQILINLTDMDIEKDDVSVWLKQSTGELELSYVSTKCMDDSLDATAEECRNEVVIARCL